MAHFLPCSRTYYTSRIAAIFFVKVVHLHGLPKTIVSDRDINFLGYFWRTLWAKTGTRLRFSRNGPSTAAWEICCTTFLWTTTPLGMSFPHAEFAYNNLANRSTSRSPFEVVTGLQHCVLVNLVPLPLTPRTSEVADDFVQDLREVHAKVHRRG